MRGARELNFSTHTARRVFTHGALAGHVDVIDVRFISQNVRNKETPGLRDFFYQIELLAGLWQSRKDEKKRIHAPIRNTSPDRRHRNIFSVNEFRTRAGKTIDQKGCLPDANKHILPLIFEVTMHVNK
jgi:hypothetical protein